MVPPIEFPTSLRFLDRPPLAFDTGLRGHVVLVVFWRLGCVHSRQAARECAELATEFGDAAVACLSVHVPTSAAERDEARLRRAVAELPPVAAVAVDADAGFCRGFGFARLPAIVLVDASGTAVWRGTGEVLRQRLRDAVRMLLDDARDKGHAAAAPIAPLRRPSGAVQPTAVAVHGDRLFVGLAGPGRVCELGPEGQVRAVHAGFALPTALCVHGERLLVADGGRHEVRALSLATGRGETVLGTGRRSTDRFGGGYGVQQGLAGPAGLCVRDQGLLVAAAGAHQVWQFDPDTGAASAWIGTGALGHCDDPERAAFHEPRGLCADEHDVFVADAGSGAVRAIERAHDVLRTVATGLARPVAVALAGDALFVAASWQPAVLRLPRGGGEPVVVAAAAHGLVEPVALAIAGERLWIADAGAGCLFAGDLATGAIARVDLHGLAAAPAGDDLAVLAGELRLLEHQDVELRIELPCGADERIDAAAPCEVFVVDEGVATLAAPRRAMAEVRDGAAELLVPVGDRGLGAWRVEVSATVRRGPDARAVSRRFRYVVPVAVGGAGAIAGVVRRA